jgi:hypothetical protein
MLANHKKFELTFSDLEMGHPVLGMMSRIAGMEPDDEDVAYRKFLKAKGLRACVHDGYVVLL